MRSSSANVSIVCALMLSTVAFSVSASAAIWSATVLHADPLSRHFYNARDVNLSFASMNEYLDLRDNAQDRFGRGFEAGHATAADALGDEAYRGLCTGQHVVDELRAPFR